MSTTRPAGEQSNSLTCRTASIDSSVVGSGDQRPRSNALGGSVPIINRTVLRAAAHYRHFSFLTHVLITSASLHSSLYDLRARDPLRRTGERTRLRRHKTSVSPSVQRASASTTPGSAPSGGHRRGLTRAVDEQKKPDRRSIHRSSGQRPAVRVLRPHVDQPPSRSRVVAGLAARHGR